MSLDQDHQYGRISAVRAGKSNRVDLVLIKTPEWMSDAACVGHDPEWWHRTSGPTPTLKAHPGGDENHDNRVRAMRICATCPVKQQCNEHGKTTRSTGLFGGEWLTGETPCSSQ